MKIITAQDIRDRVKLEDLIEPVREAFRGYSRGEASDAIAHLHPQGGEVHIKAGALRGSRVFVVKVSAGFPANAAQGLPVWDGALLALDAGTGVPLALIHDAGLLTDWRTAVAGAIGTQTLGPQRFGTLGMVGSGLQGFWQPLAHRALLEFETLLLWGRDPRKAEILKTQLEPHLPGVTVIVEPQLERLVRRSDVVVSATASTGPLIRAEWVRAGQHFTALGADTPGKQELEVGVLERADRIAVDSWAVNRQYGEVAVALAQGLAPEQVLELGTLLEPAGTPERGAGEITVCKLVGLGVQDLASVLAALERLA